MTSDQYQPQGTHLLADLSGVAGDRLNDPAAIDQLLRRAALAAGATVLSGSFHHFGNNHGVTGVVLLAESHISIHTWPESGFAALDIFMCGQARPALALNVITAGLQAADCVQQTISRGAAVTVAG